MRYIQAFLLCISPCMSHFSIIMCSFSVCGSQTLNQFDLTSQYDLPGAAAARSFLSKLIILLLSHTTDAMEASVHVMVQWCAMFDKSMWSFFLVYARALVYTKYEGFPCWQQKINRDEKSLGCFLIDSISSLAIAEEERARGDTLCFLTHTTSAHAKREETKLPNGGRFSPRRRMWHDVYIYNHSPFAWRAAAPQIWMMVRCRRILKSVNAFFKNRERLLAGIHHTALMLPCASKGACDSWHVWLMRACISKSVIDYAYIRGRWKFARLEWKKRTKMAMY